MLVDIIFIFYLYFIYDASAGFDSRISALEGNIDNPNERYSTPRQVGTWNSTSNVDTFFSNFNHNNRYNTGTVELQLGDYIRINDGKYNTDWIIAGFDMEHGQLAADGTIYDNGYGICLIPKTDLGSMTWNNSDTLVGAYKSSTMHTSHLVTVANKLKTVLGDHLVLRNVLLSSSVNGSCYSNAYTWTTSYATLMSVGQLTGTFRQHRNQYDDGEANYKLPLFDYEEYTLGHNFWMRGVYGNDEDIYYAWQTRSNGSFNLCFVSRSSSNDDGMRPLIYLR